VSQLFSYCSFISFSQRREVIRCLGVLGAIDPDRYQVVASKARKGGAVGGAYFEEQDDGDFYADASKDLSADPDDLHGSRARAAANVASDSNAKKESDPLPKIFNNDDDLPAHLSMYEQYAMVVQPVSSFPPARRITPSDEMFYPTVAIQALMRIFKEPALAVHHGLVIQAIMFIFKSLGLRCIPFLVKVVPHMIAAVRQKSGPSNYLRESLLKQLASLSEIVREHLSPYIADIFDVVEQFWSSRHLATIFVLISKVAVGVPDEFQHFVPRLTRRLLTSLDELQVGEWSTSVLTASASSPVGKVESDKLDLILRSINSLRSVLGGYLHMLVPALLKLSDSLTSLSATLYANLHETPFVDLHVLSLRTTAALLECQANAKHTSTSADVWGTGNQHSVSSNKSGLAARTVQPLVRLLRSKPPICRDLGLAAIEGLCVCAKQIGGARWLQSYHDVVVLSISFWDEARRVSTASTAEANQGSLLSNDEEASSALAYYNDVVDGLLSSPQHQKNDVIFDVRKDYIVGGEARQLSFAESPANIGVGDSGTLELDQNIMPPLQPLASRQRINQGNLQRAWDVTQIASRDDWDQWMRTLSIQLLREAPSPSLRATANLANAYQVCRLSHSHHLMFCATRLTLID